MKTFTDEALRFLINYCDCNAACDSGCGYIDLFVVGNNDTCEVVSCIPYGEAADIIQKLIEKYLCEVYYRECVEPIIFEFEEYLKNHNLNEYLTSDESLLFAFLDEFNLDGSDMYDGYLIGYKYEEVDNYYGRSLIEPFIELRMDKQSFKEWLIKYHSLKL